jgi:hypothetical protein
VQNGNTTTQFSTETINVGGVPCTVYSTLGNVQNPGRFASQNTGLILRSASSSSGTTYGLCQTGASVNQYRTFVINNLYAGDVVTINGSTTFSLTSGNATADGNKFTMTAKGALGISLAGTQWIYSITIQHDDAGSYSYDPAVEIYDLYNVTGSFGTSDADFNLNGRTAKYITNLQGGMALNNRIAISTTSDGGTYNWVFNDHGLKSQYSWHNLSICNLKEGDRVVIQYAGQATFSSAGQNGGYNGCPAFKDIDNDGDFNGQDVNIANGMSLDAKSTSYDNNLQTNSYITYAYTVTEDGHLDIGLADGSRIFKITIYGDHQARMVDRYGNTPSDGNTSYFDTTGQLEAKHHIVPGGLHVYVGNEDETHHAEVVMSDKGPVSFVYDQSHFKMARHGTWGSINVGDGLPVTGTYYRFVPEVSGTMTVRFKANSISYINYGIEGNAASDQFGTPNEKTSNVECPYYLMQQNGNSPQQISTQNKNNGADLTFQNIEVTAGQTYYIYGWWQSGTNTGNLSNYYCGVAELIDVTFKPSKYVYPLAKWVKNGATISNEPELGNLATVYGYSDVCVKKKSDNIQSCTVAIEGGVLKVTSISYKAGTNPGGTVLIKVGDKDNDATPVFALTIAYDASFNKPEGAVRSEGHTWNFSDKSLNGLKWTNRASQEATVTPFGTSKVSNSLLSQEIAKGDWTFNYRVKASNGTTHDPRFLNNYDMEGDNADMIWDTEGLIFNTSSNQSCIYNEFGRDVSHELDDANKTDPDRYVGILPGGSFTIPGLKKGDRVLIFMGSGEGSGKEACFFNITNALDAIGNDITKTYKAGGSPWRGEGGAWQYRGAYNFIAKEDGDMTFTMTGGSMTKLYSIEIYTGIKKATVDCTRVKTLTYNNEVYDDYTYSFINDWRTTTPAKSAIALHYRGKGERLRRPTVVHTSGNVSTGPENLFYSENGDDKGLYVFYKSKIGDYGMFRMRVEDLELGNEYVADYALQNITVGYLEKKNYPYTWDFTDLTGYVSTYIQAERTKVGNYAPKTVTGNYDIEFMNNSVGENVKAVEQWKQYAADEDDDIPAGYGLQINNEPYGGGCMWSGGQLYAGVQPFGETYFLSIKVPETLDNQGKLQPDINKNYNGGVRICDEGLCLTGGKWTITLPLVGTIASVYVRAKQVGNEPIYAAVGDILENASFTYEGTATDGTGDKIYAIKGTGKDMKLMFNNLIIKKIAISQDPKKVNKLGYATESRNVVIDPELMGYMTGTGLKAYTVTKVVYGDKTGDIPSIKLSEIPTENVMGKAATTGDHRGYIIYNTDDAVIPEGTTEGTKAVSILDGGFHLFVPDMHDDPDADSKKTILDTEGGKNHLRSCYQGGLIPQEEIINGVSYANYLLNYKYSDKDGTHEGPEAFYRAGTSASLGTNKAYLQLLTAKVKPTNASFAKVFSIVFDDELFSSQGIATVIDNVSSNENVNENNAEWYNLNGQKLNGRPSSSGLYIVNGKKVLVK